MRIRTKNSEYEISGGANQIVVKKIADFYKGGHPNVKVGDTHMGTRLFIEIGSELVLQNGGDHPFRTSPIIGISA
mgnify:CR=1